MRLRIDSQFFRTPAGILVILVMLTVLLWALYAALRPLPGRHFAMASGPAGSAYARAAERYREILARNGVNLRVVATNGAVANAQLLMDPKSEVSVGFVQAGFVDGPAAQDLVSLGTVFEQAVWIFCRPPGAQLLQRPGIRVSIGPEGSAGRPLAQELLALNGVDPQQLQLFGYPPEEAARALLAGKLDVVMILSGWDSAVVQSLARAPDITLLSFPRADAYVALNPTLNKLVLPRGVADLATDRPPTDTALIASKASLAVRRDLHPALQYLLLSAAIEIHARAGMFQRAGEFPAAEEIDLPLSDEARHMYRAGPSFLQRELPFWLAELVQRILILVLPIAGIIYPLWSLAPRIYRWQMQRRIYRLYGELKRLERELRGSQAEVRTQLLQRLDELDRRVQELKIPLSFGEMSYNFRAHIRALREHSLPPP